MYLFVFFSLISKYRLQNQHSKWIIEFDCSQLESDFEQLLIILSTFCFFFMTKWILNGNENMFECDWKWFNVLTHEEKCHCVAGARSALDRIPCRFSWVRHLNRIWIYATLKWVQLLFEFFPNFFQYSVGDHLQMECKGGVQDSFLLFRFHSISSDWIHLDSHRISHRDANPKLRYKFQFLFRWFYQFRVFYIHSRMFDLSSATRDTYAMFLQTISKLKLCVLIKNWMKFTINTFL